MPLTKGGPSDSTQTMVTFLYNYGVTRMRDRLRQRGRRGPVPHLRGFAFGYKRILMRHD